MASFKFSIISIILALTFLATFTAAANPKRPGSIKFYMHDTLQNKTHPWTDSSEIVAGPNNNLTGFGFGKVIVFNDSLTEGSAMESTRIGKGQGVYIYDQGDPGVAFNALLIFSALIDTPEYKGTLNLMGADVIFTPRRYISVVGGTTASTHASYDVSEVGVAGAVNRFLGITPAWLRQTHLLKAPFAEDRTGYLMVLIPEIEAHLKTKCEKISAACSGDETDALSHPLKSSRLPERVKAAIDEVEAEDAALLEQLYAADRKFSEYYNLMCCTQDGMRKAWLCKRCQTMNTKLRVLEHLVLRDTYTEESITALHKIRNYLVEADEVATAAYNRAVIIMMTVMMMMMVDDHHVDLHDYENVVDDAHE